MTQGEIERRREDFIDRLFAGEVPMLTESYVGSILDRDRADAARVHDPGSVGTVLRLIAARSAALARYETLGRDAGIDGKTAKSHVDVLERLFLVRVRRPWHANLGKRQVKAPKAYVADTGLLAGLIGVDEQRVRIRGAARGPFGARRTAAGFARSGLPQRAAFASWPPGTRRLGCRTVSKGKRNRRPGGHPAKVAVRREREAARRSGAPAGPESVARRIVREAHELTSALDAELWASQLLGVFWDRRYTLPLGEAASPDYSLILGEPLVEAVARLGGDGARTALSAIAIVDDGELGIRAGVLAQKLELEQAAPGWLGDVGEAEITGAAVMREDVFDDASTVFLEARHPGGETHAIGVLIDNNLGHIAKDVLLADSIDRVAEVMRKHPRDDGELTLERINAPSRGGTDRRGDRANRDDVGSAGGG